jgi:hypothetical protein
VSQDAESAKAPSLLPYHSIPRQTRLSRPAGSDCNRRLKAPQTRDVEDRPTNAEPSQNRALGCRA